ncbi:HAD-IA family hydrolase [Pseudoclavibacter terrae]|nr:HAD-IA family hydrolase [Pseudoclavibacter terrae]
MGKKYKILSFDIVGTLVDFETGLLDALRASIDFEKHGLTDDQVLQAFGQSEELVQHDQNPGIPWGEILGTAYLDFAPKLGLPADERIAASLKASIPNWPAFPDSIEALKRLGSGRRLVGLTNGGRFAAQHMAATLDYPFDDIVTVEDIRANKPDPQVFAFMLGKQSTLGYDLPDYLHVAQSQFHDIGVAKKLGFTTAWIDRRNVGEIGFGGTPNPGVITEPTFHFHTLSELADYLDEHDS